MIDDWEIEEEIYNLEGWDMPGCVVSRRARSKPGSSSSQRSNGRGTAPAPSAFLRRATGL